MQSVFGKTLCSVSLASLGFLPGAFAETAPPVTLDIHVQQVKAKASPMLYGLMTEEINYSYDGGLYAELVRNRTFFGDRHGVPSWRLIEHGESQASMAVDKTT